MVRRPTPAAASDQPSDQPADQPSDRPFHHLLAVTGLSNLSDGVLQVGVPLLAITMSRSPGTVSVLTAAATLPWLLLALHAGVLVDRYDRVRILSLATAGRVAVLVAGAVVAASGALSVPVMLALLLALGVGEVFADSAATALVPSVVPRDRLAAANGRLLGVQQVANAFLGGPLAGLLVGLGGAALLGLPAALFAVAALLVVRGLRGTARTPARPVGPSSRPSTSMRAEMGEGFTFLWRHRVLRPLVLSATVLNFANAGYFAVLVLWVVGPGSAVGLDASWYGWLPAGLAVGALAGAALAGPLRRRLGEARLIAGAWATTTVLLAVPVLVPHVAALTATFALVGFTSITGNVVSQSLRQRLVPGHLLGRVAGVARTLAFGSMPLGAALAGVVGQVFGLVAVLLGAVGLSLVFVVWVALAVPQRRVDDADRALTVPATPATPASLATPATPETRAAAAAV
jgi:MFS family permease